MIIKLTISERIIGETEIPDYVFEYKKKLDKLILFEQCYLHFLEATKLGDSQDAIYFLKLAGEVIKEEI